MSNGRLLIVDDELSVRTSYAKSLTEAGFDVVQASDGADALRRIEGGGFDAVLSDVAMPEMDGFALLYSLRARLPGLPVIFMLDAPDNRTTVKATESGAIQSLVKPIAPDLLAETAFYAVRLWRTRGHSHPTPHNHGERAGTVSISATDAKNEFGRLLERVIQGGRVVINKHNAPKAVLISIDDFDMLSRGRGAKLDALSAEFDALLAGMQTPSARAGMSAAFDASPKQLGQAAVMAVRKRGR
jgi:antitoxin Phd